MSYSSSNHSASGRSVKFRDLEDGAGDASGSRTSSKMSAALSFDASVGLLSDASASTTSSRRGRLGKPAPLRSVSSAAEAEDDSPFRFMELLKQIYALFAALPGYGAYPTVQPGDILRAVSAYKEVITGAPMWRQMMSYTPVGTPQLKRLLFRCDDASYYDVRNAIASHRAGDGGNGIATLVIERAAGAEVPAPDSATLAAIAEATGLEPLKDVVMRDLKNKGDAEAEETRSVPERVDEFFR